jgi:hypothetical protein
MTSPASASLWRRRLEGWPGLWLLLLLCGAVYLPGFILLPPIDRDESRFAQASRQMAESADYILPRIGDRPRLNKPPMIYWAQAWSAQMLTLGDLSRDAIFMYRIPSLLGAIGTVLITWRMGCSMFDPRAAWAGAALLAICPVIVWEARQARADMLLLAFTTAAMWLAWETLRRPSWPGVLCLWFAVGLGVLTKGPVTPGIILAGTACFAALRRHPREFWNLRPILGLAIIALIVFPWVALVATRVGWETYTQTIWKETVGRGLEPAEGHAGPPGYHLLAFMIVGFPASLWLVGGMWLACRRALRRSRPGWTGLLVPRVARPAQAFLLCMVVPAWLIFEIIRTKLPHYTVPLYPAVCLLIARGAISNAHELGEWRDNAWIRLGVRAWCAVPVSWAVGAGVLAYQAVLEGHWWGWVALGIAGAGLLTFLIEGHALVGRSRYRELLERASRLAVLVFVLTGFILPRIQYPWVVRNLVAAARDADPNGTRPLAFVDPHEDSAVFLTRAKVRWINAGDVPAFLRANPDALLVVPQTLGTNGLRTLATVRGLNYSSQWNRGTWYLVEARP